MGRWGGGEECREVGRSVGEVERSIRRWGGVGGGVGGGVWGVTTTEKRTTINTKHVPHILPNPCTPEDGREEHEEARISREEYIICDFQ